MRVWEQLILGFRHGDGVAEIVEGTLVEAETSAPMDRASTQQAVDCFGVPATIVGTEAGEVIDGTSGDDVIQALGGNDTINGLGGGDRICAGAGNDVVNGGASARDFIFTFGPASGIWFVHGGLTQQWGLPSDIPVPGDYDGDGDTDVAVWRPLQAGSGSSTAASASSGGSPGTCPWSRRPGTPSSTDGATALLTLGGRLQAGTYGGRRATAWSR